MVSCYVSGKAEPATFLHSAQRTGEVAPGNRHGTTADRDQRGARALAYAIDLGLFLR